MATNGKYGTKIPGGYFDESFDSSLGRLRHCYRDESGMIVPSLTQILSMLRFTDLSAAPPDRVIYKQKVGTAVHAATEYLDSPDHGDLDWDSVQPEIFGYIQAYENAVAELGLQSQKVEHASITEVNGMKFGCRLDRVGTFGKNGIPRMPIIWEIKTAYAPSFAWHLQTAAQSLTVPKPKGVKEWYRIAISLRPDGSFLIDKHDDPKEINWFRCALTMVHLLLREKHRLPEIPEIVDEAEIEMPVLA